MNQPPASTPRLTPLPANREAAANTEPLSSSRTWLRATIAASLVEHAPCAWPRRLRAIVLAGSMARDEATLRRQGEWLDVLGDAECLLVFRAGPLPPAAQVETLAAQIHDDLLCRGIRCRIDLSPVTPQYFVDNPPHIFGYELRRSGRVLWGDEAVLRLMPGYGAAELPARDGWYLLSNRMIEFLEIAAARPRSDSVATELGYAAVKLCLDAAASYLLFLHRFETGYRARQQALARLAAIPGRGVHPLPIAAFARRVDRCTQLKLAQRPLPALEPQAVLAILNDASRLWQWELAQLAGLDLSPGTAPLAAPLIDQLWRTAAARAPRLRGWLAVVRAMGWGRSWAHWGGWAAHAFTASPRFWTYRAAGFLFDLLPGQIFTVPGLAGTSLAGAQSPPRLWLPLDQGTGRAVAASWRGWAVAVARNYHQLVEHTRS